jgi:hemerythrin-like domain-containing protein
MTTISAFMTDDHRACDERLADVETQVQSEHWSAARDAWQGFERAMRCHFAREEELLFPAFERATGQAGGPTTVMRMEHDQIRALLGQLEAALVGEDGDRFLGLSDTLMVLMQQHNMKEEQILYPMSEQMIPDIERVLAELAAIVADPA